MSAASRSIADAKGALNHATRESLGGRVEQPGVEVAQARAAIAQAEALLELVDEVRALRAILGAPPARPWLR